MQDAILFREIHTDEVEAVHKLGQRGFVGFESLWVSKPKRALLAIKDGEIAGAMLYKILQSGNKKVGYVDFIFTDPAVHGQGVGNLLFQEGITHLWAQGCDALTAIVKDDNVASWSLFMKNGFTRASLIQAAKIFGIYGIIKQYFITPHCISIGMDYYIALREKPIANKEGSLNQIGLYLLINGLIILPILLRIDNIHLFLTTYLLMLFSIILTSAMSTMFSKRQWRFRSTNGGGLISFLLNFVTIYPMIGKWYPAHYEKSPNFRKEVGINALSEWILLVVIAIVSIQFSDKFPSLRIAGEISGLLCLYRCIPFYPFESFGGRRVFDWNRLVFGIFALSSILLFIRVILL